MRFADVLRCFVYPICHEAGLNTYPLIAQHVSLLLTAFNCFIAMPHTHPVHDANPKDCSLVTERHGVEYLLDGSRGFSLS